MDYSLTGAVRTTWDKILTTLQQYKPLCSLFSQGAVFLSTRPFVYIPSSDDYIDVSPPPWQVTFNGVQFRYLISS